MGRLQSLKNGVGGFFVARSEVAAALREAAGEVAFVWAHFQLVAKPKNALDEQILSFGLAGALDGIQGMLTGKCRLRELDRWEVLFAGILRAHLYCHRYADHDISGAIAKVKARLCPPPRQWPDGPAKLIRSAVIQVSAP